MAHALLCPCTHMETAPAEFHSELTTCAQQGMWSVIWRLQECI